MKPTPRFPTLAPRKTARQKRATRTLEAILEAGARILEAQGFEGYTTNAIAQRAGVSIGSLYQYFPNKDAITLALIARESAIVLQEVRAAAASADWQHALDQMVEAAVRHQLRRPRLARLLDLEEARLPAHDEATSGAAAMFDAVQSVVARTGRGDTARLTADVIGIARGMTDMAGQREEADIEDLTRRVRRAVSAYLG